MVCVHSSHLYEGTDQWLWNIPHLIDHLKTDYWQPRVNGNHKTHKKWIILTSSCRCGSSWHREMSPLMRLSYQLTATINAATQQQGGAHKQEEPTLTQSLNDPMSLKKYLLTSRLSKLDHKNETANFHRHQTIFAIHWYFYEIKYLAGMGDQRVVKPSPVPLDADGTRTLVAISGRVLMSPDRTPDMRPPRGPQQEVIRRGHHVWGGNRQGHQTDITGMSSCLLNTLDSIIDEISK